MQQYNLYRAHQHAQQNRNRRADTSSHGQIRNVSSPLSYNESSPQRGTTETQRRLI
jgi:hypothetical protein